MPTFYKLFYRKTHKGKRIIVIFQKKNNVCKSNTSYMGLG